MPGTRPLTSTEAAAWRAMMVFWRQGLPHLESTFRRVGLNHLEYGLLAVLSEQPDGSMPAGELARLAGVTSSRLSHRLKSLDQNGDVQRLADPHDRRSVVVAVTDQGRHKVDAVYEAHLADVRRLVFDHLDAEQTAQLAAAMSAIARNLTSHHFLEGS